MPHEEVTIGNARLILWDCREALPGLDLAGTALLTDPPYGLGDLWQGGGGTKRTSWRFDPREAKAWDRAQSQGSLLPPEAPPMQEALTLP